MERIHLYKVMSLKINPTHSVPSTYLISNDTSILMAVIKLNADKNVYCCRKPKKKKMTLRVGGYCNNTIIIGNFSPKKMQSFGNELPTVAIWLILSVMKATNILATKCLINLVYGFKSLGQIV